MATYERRPWPDDPRYQIDTEGNVFGPRGHKLTGGLNRAGYRRLLVYRQDGSPRCVYVHRMVLETFVGPCPEGSEACHRNGDKTDNRPENLRWDTHAANMADLMKHGGHRAPKGEAHLSAKLSAADVRVIRQRIEAGENKSAIAREYGVAPQTIHKIAAGLTWRSVEAA